jgi:hypothetical protein
MDPGVFCPNVTLEEVAWANPENLEDLVALAPVKGWWAQSFADEVLETLRPGDAPPAEPARQRGRRKRASSGG